MASSASFTSGAAARNLAGSSATPAASSPFVISNIFGLIPIKLDGTNYLMWKSLSEPILRGQNLMHHVDGSPSPDSSSSEYNFWYVTDQSLLSWFNATLSLSALPYTIGVTIAKEAWDKLSRRFSQVSTAHVLSLRKQLHNIKKGSQSMGAYLQ